MCVSVSLSFFSVLGLGSCVFVLYELGISVLCNADGASPRVVKNVMLCHPEPVLLQYYTFMSCYVELCLVLNSMFVTP